jgi:hypothetical protein
MLKSLGRIFLSFLLINFIITPAFAAPSHQSSLTGNDISYPQCGTSFPSNQAFGIVGINDGLANTTNPCLSSELSWGHSSSGGTNQATEQVYVNTANPGGLNTPSWPQNNTDPSGNVAPNTYGTCDGSNSLPCSWQYGWNRAVEDVQVRFIPQAQAAGISTSASNYPWWMDIETNNSWESGSPQALQENVADIEGMVAYFQSLGATVGIYSTTTMWGQIVGTLSSSSTLNGLNNWRPGANSLKGAQSNCSLAPLTTGGKVTITQYSSRTFDYDNSCI